MDAERWQKIKSVFDAAMDIDRSKRDGFLDETCADDADLRVDVQKLLDSFEKAESFIEQPAVNEVASLIVEPKKTLKEGQQFGHYKIIRQIGAGGMGEVYLAQDEKLDRHVAIKVLNDKFSEHESNLHRFTQEAKAASSLNHPNILIIHEVGEHESAHYLVSEFIEGITLRELINERSLQLQETLDISIQIANGLAAAHGLHLVHRDIKPENIMIRPDGYAKVLDFGLAKLVEERNKSFIGLDDETVRENETAKGVILGTVNYMSPEQAKGGKVDERTDIFSLGSVVYEMVVGKSPFKADTMSETFANLINAEPQPLSRYAASVPDELQRIVSKMLRKDQDERYQTARDLLIDLRSLKRDSEYKSHESHTTGQIAEHQTELLSGPAITSQTKNDGSRKWLFGLVAICLLGIGVAGFWLFGHRNVASENPVIDRNTQITSWSGLDCYPAISGDGNSIAFSSDRTGVFEIYVKQLVDGAREVQLTTDDGQNFEPAFSPNGSLLAFHSKKHGGIWVIPVTGGTAKQIVEVGSHPAWSPDGTLIAYQTDPITALDFNAANAQSPSTLWIVSAAGGDPKQLTQVGQPSGGHGAPNWSPDGKRIVFDSSSFGGHTVWSISVKGDDLKQISSDRQNATDAIYAPDGRSIYVIDDRGSSLKKINITESGDPIGDPIKVFDASGSRLRQLAIAGSGKRLAYSSLSTSGDIWSTAISADGIPAKGHPTQLTEGRNTRNTQPAFSPDGKKIGYEYYAIGSNFGVWLMDSDGNNKSQLSANGSEVSWFPDGKQIAFSTTRDGRHGFWSMTIDSRKETKLFDFDGLSYAIRMSPDGKKITFNSDRNGPTNIWTMPITGGEPKQVTDDKESAGYTAWSPDGKWIAFQRKHGGDTNVYIMPSDGGESIQLTSEKGQSWVHDWSPDGDKIVFAGQRNDIWNVYSVSRTTKEVKQLTNFTKLTSFVRYPAWSPINDQIIYEYGETTGNIWMLELK